jgi:hypothetical protein
MNRLIFAGVMATLVASGSSGCSSRPEKVPNATTGAAGGGGPPLFGTAGAGAAAGASGGSGGAGDTGAAGARGTAGASGAAGSGGVAAMPPVNMSLCAGLVSDKAAHPMTALAKPAVGATVIDAEFGTTIRRITAVSPTSGSNPALRPLYSTVSAWNADESLLILYNVGHGHELYDGKTYQFIRALSDIHPADLEQVYWHTSDPDVFFYVDGKAFIRCHVATAQKETVTTFSFCTGNASAGSDPMFTSFDSKRIGLACDGQSFIYDIASNQVIAKHAYAENPAQVSASGNLAWLDSTGRVTDAQLNVVRTLDLANPLNHSTLGLSPAGVDTWYGFAFDPGPHGDDDIGALVTFDLTTGQSRTIIGPKTGFPYPPSGHVSVMAYRKPGWAFVSTFGDLTGKGLLDLEVTVANTVDGTVCRAGRHRSWGKSNTQLADAYWAEAHAVPSPTGTRILFASDWGNGATVDSYVIELPSYGL